MTTTAKRRDPKATEIVVLRGLASGHTIREIAARLYLSSSGVSMRLARVTEAMGCRTTSQAIYEATMRGLLGEVPRP